MNKIEGNRILIKLVESPSGAGTPVVLAGQTSGSLGITKEMLEYTSKTTVDGAGIPVRRYLPTRSGATISVTALEDPSGDLKASEIYEMCYDGIKVKFAVGDTAVGSTVIGGSGFLTGADASFDMDSPVSGSFTLQVDGGLTFTTVTE
jgi:hypothetical protein